MFLKFKSLTPYRKSSNVIQNNLNGKDTTELASLHFLYANQFSRDFRDRTEKISVKSGDIILQLFSN